MSPTTRRRLTLLLLATARHLAGCQVPRPTAGPLDLPLPSRWIGDLDPQRRIHEPSSIVFHPARHTLFVVGDEGDHAELDRDDALRRVERIQPGADSEDGSAILEQYVPLRHGSDGAPARVVRHLPIEVLDLSALHHAPPSGHLLAVSDATNTLLEVGVDGRIHRAWPFSGDNHEGLAPDPDERLYVAQDSGGILKMQFLRPTTGVSPAAE